MKQRTVIQYDKEIGAFRLARIIRNLPQVFIEPGFGSQIMTQRNTPYYSVRTFQIQKMKRGGLSISQKKAPPGETRDDPLNLSRLVS